MPDTPRHRDHQRSTEGDARRHRDRAAEVLAAAFPDLTEAEVRRLLSKAQKVKRGEVDFSIIQPKGQGITIDAAVKS